MAEPSRSLIPILVGMMLLTGVCNTLLTKYQDIQCVADCDGPKPRGFQQPVIQTLQMFVGEAGCWLVVFFSAAFRWFRQTDETTPIDEIQYEPVVPRDSDEVDAHGLGEEGAEDLATSQTLVDPTNIIAKPGVDAKLLATERKPLTGWKVVLLACPAICDICGTTLMNVGLLFVAASIFQMTRGALVLFVGLFSVLFLKRHLGAWKWISLFVVVLGVAIVGLAGVVENKGKSPKLPGNTDPDHQHDALYKALLFVRDGISVMEEHTAGETVLGFFLIAAAQIFTATQFVLEESIMEHYEMDPIKVVGWEGIFGFLVTLIGMGIAHVSYGQTKKGRGGYFDARQGFYEMFHYPAIAITSLLIMISIGGFNFFGLSVTRSISATARSTIDTCRTLFIWLVSLGLGWESFKWLQVLGFIMLVYGTAIFNDVVQPPTIAFVRRNKRGPIALAE